ncbi:MAG: hypothetical protein AAGJ35_06275, partial [Myxococcota bacterium]
RATVNFLTTHFGLERNIDNIWQILTIDRFYLDLRTKYIDFRLGKQSFEWGPAVIWNLTAPFNQQNALEPNAERPGLWGLNAYVGYSATGGFRLAVLAEPNIQISSEDILGAKAFVRWEQTFGETQIAATVLWSSVQKHMIFGAELKGQLGVGFWSELAGTVPYNVQPEERSTRQNNIQVVVGIDYSLPILDGFTFLLQYYYNHLGADQIAQYPSNTPSGRAQLNQTFQTLYQLSRTEASAQTNFNPGNFAGLGGGSSGFVAAHYFLGTAQLTFLDDFQVSFFVLSNLVDPSMMVGPGFRATFLSNFTFSFNAYFTIGPKNSEFQPGAREIRIRREDGSILNTEVVYRASATLLAQLRFNY